MTKAFLLNLNKKALFFLYCLFAITYEKRLPKLVRQPLFVWFQLFYYNKGFLFYVVFIVISIAIRLVLSEMKDWEYI